jgi:hypothetical protein
MDVKDIGSFQSRFLTDLRDQHKIYEIQPYGERICSWIGSTLDGSGGFGPDYDVEILWNTIIAGISIVATDLVGTEPIGENDYWFERLLGYLKVVEEMRNYVG